MVEQEETILDVHKVMDAIIAHNNCQEPNCHINEILNKVFGDIDN